MAAPTVSTSQQQATLKRLLKKEKTPKVIRKNLLCSEIQEWPRPSDLVQEQIIKHLSEKLMSLPNIFKKADKNSNKAEIKAKIRSQLAIGVSQVFRDLEKDRLDCVLVSGQATPAITVNHVITLCQEKCCPVLCLEQLAVSVAKSSDTKCFPLAIGFKKMSDGDFSEIVSLVKSNSPASTTKSASIAEDTLVKLMSEDQPVGPKPIKLSGQVEEKILAELKSIFTVIVASSGVKQHVKKKTKKKSKKHVNLKNAFDKDYHPLFDFGKRTVKELVERDKVQLVLVSEEITPVLLAEPQLSSLLCSALEKNCPVLVVTGMTTTLRSLCQGCVSVVGIKRFLTNSSKDKHFEPFVDMCLKAIASRNTDTEPADLTSPAADLKKTTTLSSTEVKNKEGSPDEIHEDYSYLYILKKESKELSESVSKLKAEMEKSKQDQKFGYDFISLSEGSQKLPNEAAGNSNLTSFIKPKSDFKQIKTQRIFAISQVLQPPAAVKVNGGDESMIHDEDSELDSGNSQMLVDQKIAISSCESSSSIAAGDTQCFTLSRAGDSSLLQKNKKASELTSTILTPNIVKEVEEIGARQLPETNKKITSGIDYVILADPSSLKSKKKSLKRKMKTEGYLSFTYKPANIRAMTPNPNKKKKK